MKKKNTQSEEEFYSDELFIVYANNFLVENVENFKNITDAIHEMDNRFFFTVMEYGRETNKPSEEEAQFLNGHEYSVGRAGFGCQ